MMKRTRSLTYRCVIANIRVKIRQLLADRCSSISRYQKANNVLFCMLLVLLPIDVLSANDTSAGQALDQLRILQQQLLTSSSSANPLTPQHAQAAASTKKTSPLFPHQTTQSKSQPKSTESALDRRERVANQASSHADSYDVVDQEKSVEKLAFEGVEEQLFPLSENEIKALHKEYNRHEYARTTPVDTPPKPIATSQFVNLSPGSTPPVIRLSQGFVSSLVFLDSTGAPWPISAYDLGDPAAFNIQWDKTSNTLMIQSNKLYTYGNLAVRLKDLNTPVMLTLIPGQKAVDYRVDLRVQGYGPNAKNIPMEEGMPPSASDVLLHILDGVPPAGSRRLTVSGGDARAWLLENTMFVRTNLTILSPGWVGSMTSADGMHAYEMQKSPVLLVSWHGKVMQLKVEGL